MEHLELALKGILQVLTFTRAPEGSQGLLEDQRSGLGVQSK